MEARKQDWACMVETFLCYPIPIPIDKGGADLRRGNTNAPTEPMVEGRHADKSSALPALFYSQANTSYPPRWSLMQAVPTPSWFSFLRIEADLAMTFISIARHYPKPWDSARSLRNARKALEEIRRGLMKPIRFSADEIVFLKRRCTEIESELKAFRPATHH